MILNQIRIVLVNTTHPGNIGAVSRAMKNMGFFRLYLVSPQSFPDPEAIQRASGADDILAHAKITANLSSALLDCRHIYMASTRQRTLPWPSCTPESCAHQILTTSSEEETALVFGCESSGLTNEEIAWGHYQIQIPSNPEFSSLNLAQAVQIMVYEIYKLLNLDKINANTLSMTENRNLVTSSQMSGFYKHLEDTLLHLKFIDHKQPKMLMQRLKRLFNRASLDQVELNILRGILTAILQRKV